MTVLDALKANVSYPLSGDFFLSVATERGLSHDDEFHMGVGQTREFLLAKADCLVSVASGINFTEGSLSVGVPDRDKLIRIANSIYSRFGEPLVEAEASVRQPSIRHLDW